MHWHAAGRFILFVLYWAACVVLGVMMVFGVMYVVSETIDNAADKQIRLKNCLERSINGLQVEECKRHE